MQLKKKIIISLLKKANSCENNFTTCISNAQVYKDKNLIKIVFKKNCITHEITIYILLAIKEVVKLMNEYLKDVSGRGSC